MKKIVSAALVASMVAGAAFAADAKITLNYRTKLDAFAYTKESKAGNDKITQEWFDWEGYDGAGKQAETKASDTFKFVLNAEKAGATFAANINTNDSSYTLNQYSAWMKWEVGEGELKLESGNWKDGYVDNAYRVKKDVDAQNAEGQDFERFKLGTILKGSKRLTFIDDMAAGVAYGNQKGLFSCVDYGFTTGSDAKINILLGSVYDKFDVVADDDTTKYFDAFFVSRVQAKIPELLDAELIFKKPAPHVMDFGFYVMPKVLDGLTLNIGGAAEIDNREKDDGGYTDWAFDLRARYQATDELSLTLFTNLSGTNLDAGRKIASGVVGHKGGEGWATKQAFKTAMWNNVSARYKVSDLLALTLNVGLITPLSKVDGDDESYTPEWRITPAAQIYAASNASVWAGLAISGISLKDADSSVMSLQVPVIFRVKM